MSVIFENISPFLKICVLFGIFPKHINQIYVTFVIFIQIVIFVYCSVLLIQIHHEQNMEEGENFVRMISPLFTFIIYISFAITCNYTKRRIFKQIFHNFNLLETLFKKTFKTRSETLTIIKYPMVLFILSHIFIGLIFCYNYFVLGIMLGHSAHYHYYFSERLLQYVVYIMEIIKSVFFYGIFKRFVYFNNKLRALDRNKWIQRLNSGELIISTVENFVKMQTLLFDLVDGINEVYGWNFLFCFLHVFVCLLKLVQLILFARVKEYWNIIGLFAITLYVVVSLRKFSFKIC